MVRRNILILITALSALVLTIACGAVGSRMETGNANKLVDEANAANTEAAKISTLRLIRSWAARFYVEKHVGVTATPQESVSLEIVVRCDFAFS